MPEFVIIGCGYVGERLARRLPGRVTAVVRSPSGTKRLLLPGIDVVCCDLDALDGASRLPVETAGAVMFYLAPPPGTGPADPRLGACLAALPDWPGRIVYMSTTGVYGDAAGATVDEERPPAPATDRARARLDAETAVRRGCEAAGAEWTILRVPGIYGPGRLPLERIRRGDPMIGEPEAGPGNRIHVDDLVSVCIAAGTKAAAANRLYNVGDGNHASTTAYFSAVARLAGLPEPPALARAEARGRLAPETWSFLGESRRVDTARMRRELGVALRYEDLEAGIRASLQPP